jgi:aminoglycoside 6-adenylyltransferase
MRSEAEMLELILETAREDDRIRAVIMNGSRVNPEAPRDIFQDYDIVYLVTDIEPYQHNLEWIQRFGELMILQLPDEMDDPPPAGEVSFAYLMQFADGNRIDLTIFPLAKLDQFGEDSLTLLLLDKDGILGPFPPPSERSYLPTPPTPKQFADCCNEFWWVSPYVAKGLWRGEIVYAKYTFEILREELLKMLGWYVGVKTGFSSGPGKFGKHLHQRLEPELWELLQKTYSDAGTDHTWEALFAIGELFRIAAVRVAEELGFGYPSGDDERVSAHLRHVRCLPREAKELY